MPGVIEQRAGTQAIPQVWQATLDESAVSVDWSASGLWLAAASASGNVCVFNSADGECVRELSAHRFGATTLVWHPYEDRFATAGQDGFVRLWEPGRDAAIKELDAGSAWAEHVAWSDNGRLLATAAGRRLKVWSRGGELIREYPNHPNTIAAITWKRNAEELVSACYGQLQFWSPESAGVLRTFYWKGSMLALAWSPDGRYLCHGNQDATVHFWVVRTGKELQMWGYPTKVRELAWDYQSRYLATGGGSSITVWDCSGKGPANSKPAELKLHRRPVTHLAYQRAGGVLASACAEGQLALWRPGKRMRPDAVAALPAAIAAVSWSPNDRLIAAADEDGGVTAFRYPERSA